jgi:hypothetical protein
MSALGEVPLFQHLGSARRILLAGCGGGFDVYCGLPLFLALRERGHEVFLANLSFADPHAPGTEAITAVLTRVDEAASPTSSYFPEYYLACWLADHGHPSSVYCFDRTGVVPLREAYQELTRRLELDAIVVVDGGTDSLMRGDEAGLGTPHEDVLTLVALDGLPPERYLVCLGFGVDAFHGVCHAHFLENTAALVAARAFLGAFCLLPQFPEAQAYIEAVRFATARDPTHPSIVNTSIAAAIEGRYGNHHATTRTRGSELWINPLMAIYWCFELQAVVDRVLYREMLRATQTFNEVIRFVEAARKTFEGRRERKPIPV